MVAPDPIILSHDLDPWERQPGESPARYKQFCTYLELGTSRTLAAAARALDRNPVHIRQTAAAYHWRERAAARDAEDFRIVRANTLQDRIIAVRDDAKVLLTLRARLATYIRTMDLSAWEPAEFLRLLEIVLRQGRALFGGSVDLAAALGGAEDGAAGSDPFAAEVEEWAAMTPAARAEQMRHLTRLADARLAALSGLDDP